MVSGAVSAAAQPQSDAVTRIQISGGYRGRTDGCNCAGGQAGGLAWRASLLERVFGSEPPPMLDAGSILDLDIEGGERRSACAVRGLARMGLRVIGITPRDMFYGGTFLRETASKEGIRLVSANLMDAQSGERLFDAWATLDWGGWKFAVTSLSSRQVGRRYSGAFGWIPAYPDSSLPELLASIPPNCDICILLTDLEEGEICEMLEKIHDFDVVLTCSRRMVEREPFLLNGTLVIHTAVDGRALEWLEITRNGTDGKPQLSHRQLPVLRDRRPDARMVEWLNDCQAAP